jgi:hypothetical protein
LIARAAVASVLVVAGIAKLALPRQFEETLTTFGLLPSGVNRVLVRLLPVVEVLVGVAVAINWPSLWCGLAASVLFVVLGTAVGVRLLIRTTADPVKCGCFGGSGQALSWRLVLRDLALAVLAVAAVAAPAVAGSLLFVALALWSVTLVACGSIEGAHSRPGSEAAPTA